MRHAIRPTLERCEDRKLLSSNHPGGVNFLLVGASPESWEKAAAVVVTPLTYRLPTPVQDGDVVVRD